MTDPFAWLGTSQNWQNTSKKNGMAPAGLEQPVSSDPICVERTGAAAAPVLSFFGSTFR